MNWHRLAEIGLNIAGALVPAANTVERIAKSIAALRGKSKEDAALELAKEALGVATDLLDDPLVEAAARSFLQGYVSLQTAVAAAQARGTSANVH